MTIAFLSIHGRRQLIRNHVRTCFINLKLQETYVLVSYLLESPHRFEFVFESQGNSSDSSRKQILGIFQGNLPTLS